MGQVEADSGKRGEYVEYERGCTINFLELATDDGFVPICVTKDGSMHVNPDKEKAFKTNMHKPVLAQHIAFLVQRDGGNTDWIKPYYGKLEAFLSRYLESHVEKTTGLAYWQDDFAVGVYVVWQNDRLEKQQIIVIKDMKPTNDYLAWYYEPIRAKKGVWSKVSYDPFAKKELVSYTVPLYMNGQLVGVVGIDFDYELYRHKTQKEALSRALEGVGQLSEYAQR
jgi:hypothetical protein